MSPRLPSHFFLRASLAMQYLSPGRQRGLYLGWVGCGNLGDEAIWQACRDNLAPTRFRPMHGGRMEQWLLNRFEKGKHKPLVLGGGTIVHHHWYHLVEESVRRHHPVIVFAPGVEAPDRWPSESTGRPQLKHWAELLSRCDLVAVRGQDSADALEKAGFRPEVVGDPACLMAVDERRGRPAERTLGFNIARPLLDVSEDTRQSIVELLKKLKSQHWAIEFLVINGEDLKITQEIREKAGLVNSPIHTVVEDTRRYLAICSRYTAFFGTRLHAVVLSMCANVPSLMLAYAPKGFDFMRSVGMERFALSLQCDSFADELNSRSDELILMADELEIEIHDRIGILKSQLMDYSHRARTILNQGGKH